MLKAYKKKETEKPEELDMASGKGSKRTGEDGIGKIYSTLRDSKATKRDDYLV